MNVADLELFLIELPTSGPAVRALLVRLVTDAGVEGWGETRTTWCAAELGDRRKVLLAVLAGRDAFDVESLLGLDALSEPAVACGVEMALWDAVARRCGQPLAHLWGGCYREHVPVSVRLPVGSPEAVAHWARVFFAQGIGSQTVTAGGAVDDDLKLIAAVREACGERLALRFDARLKYDLRGATRLCTQLEPDDVQYVLDPLARADFESLAVLRSRARVRLAALAGIGRPADVARLARAEAASFVAVDPVQVGGVLRAGQCAVVAESVALAAGVHIEGTSGLALAATLQLAAATPGLASGHERSHPRLLDDVLAEPFRVVDGMLVVPTGPGLGVTVDRDKVERYQVTG